MGARRDTGPVIGRLDLPLRGCRLWPAVLTSRRRAGNRPCSSAAGGHRGSELVPSKPALWREPRTRQTRLIGALPVAVPLLSFRPIADAEECKYALRQVPSLIMHNGSPPSKERRPLDSGAPAVCLPGATIACLHRRSVTGAVPGGREACARGARRPALAGARLAKAIPAGAHGFL